MFSQFSTQKQPEFYVNAFSSVHHLVVVRGVCTISAIETQHVTENSLHMCGLEQIRHNKVQVTQPKTSDYTSARKYLTLAATRYGLI